MIHPFESYFSLTLAWLELGPGHRYTDSYSNNSQVGTVKGKKLLVINNPGPQVEILNWPRPLLDSQGQASLTNRGCLAAADVH